ncbi:NCS1 nucleoside transporter family [Branchiibius hedensis]|uniref:NCS1 nucleoside transporter family n=1 Tax=Branchiibius hedensis TaxID=672460 RepID=A0A2Y8ZV22_9MICO|nr:cytosine permease [Branchiibius hedensis]PWJ26534.1 NCS1 nucleoside transporter family [Branchiibius hedensis]SSA35346.1 NCS1 nucleoside transporter family [Branchiibius hedensis]
MSTDVEINPISAEDYGHHLLAIEPGGVDVIPEDQRHGRPIDLLWTWTSPNMEFATIGVGILGPLFWGLNLWQTIAAIILGTALGSLTHAVLSSWGPQSGLCQMVLSRTGFGFLGNILPAGLNAVIAGIGWFAVNSISGALALHALIPGLAKGLALAIVVLLQLAVAFLGHNLVQAFERWAFPILAVVFAIGAVIVFSKSHPSVGTGGTPTVGAFLLMAGASFGYACGWNPYASDYTRYQPRGNGAKAGLFAGLGILISCVILESAGAAMVSAAGKAANVDPGVYTGLLPTWLGKLTLLCIAIGAICANALNIYSGAMSALAIGFRTTLHRARAFVAVGFGILGFLLALAGMDNAGENYENFLLVIAYWIGPWLGFVLTDRWLNRGADFTAIAQDRGWQNWAGPIAMLVGIVVSVWLFSNQANYTGPIPSAHPQVGDITYLVGFLLSAGIYAGLRRVLPPKSSTLVP